MKFHDNFTWFVLIVISPSFYFGESCWEENQETHDLTDLKLDKDAFNYFAFSTEDGVPGFSKPIIFYKMDSLFSFFRHHVNR